jgi:hypothetical protein
MNQTIAIFQRLQRSVNRKLVFCGILAITFLAIYLPIKAVETQATAKKLIEYGWNAPTPDFVRKHIKEMEQRPFDGVMLKLNAGKEVFHKTPYPETAFAQDRRDLAATKSTKLTDNFVVMWSGMDKEWDWFNNDDWNAAAKNITNFAKTAKIGRLKGIAFDSEAYTTSPWQYRQQPQQQLKTFSEYQKQVRKRGAQFMQAIQVAQPNPHILTFGLLSWLKDLMATGIDSAELDQKLANHNYGLWPAFINGMLDVARPGTVIIDGHEWAYYFYGAKSFDRTHDFIFKDARKFVEPVNYRKYDQQVKVGQAVFLDLLIKLVPKHLKTSPFAETLPHFLSPANGIRLLEHNTYHSLRTADRYAWLYSEHVDWWKNNIPQGVESAILRAKTKIKTRQSLGFDLDPAVKQAFEECRRTSTKC